jgi:transcriptional regulator with XRE-family HTH domain
MARRTTALSKAIAQRLRLAKTARGLSVRQLAERALVDKNSVVRLYYGRSMNPSIGIIVDLARALHVDPAWLAFGVGEGPSVLDGGHDTPAR